jgi:hypothetical protein
MRQLKDVAAYVRSKAAGPFWVTVDIFAGEQEAFDLLCAAPALTASAVAQLYGVRGQDVRIFHDANLKVIKVSFPRLVSQGSARDVDSHAGQQFVPLLSVMVEA